MLILQKNVMVTMQNIERFLKNKEIAIIGASKDRKKFGNIVMRFLDKRGYEVYPVNPVSIEIEGKPSYLSVHDLPEKVKAAVFITKPDVSETILSEIINGKKIGHIWLQQGAENQNAVLSAEKVGLNIIHGECIMMFAKQSGFPHSIHRFFKKTFGKYPEK
jgi:uncharacterized protein